MSMLILHNYCISLLGGDNLSIIEGLMKIMPILYSFILVGVKVYTLPWQTKLKDNNVLLTGLSFIIIGSIINLKVAYKSYEFLFFSYQAFIFLGSSIIIIQLFRTIKLENYYATKDTLTGAYNKRVLYNTIELHIKKAQKNGSVFALAFIDIDNFKSLNDNLGHIAADNIIKGLCTGIRKKIRKKDMLFRYGGDEFVLLIPGANKKEGEQLLKRLKKELNEESGDILDFSYGTASYPEDGENAETLLNAADLQMYCQKNPKY